jgi:hypothetical protein
MNERSIASFLVRQAPAPRDAELHIAAEMELAAFYGAVLEMHGTEEARHAAQDWIDALERMEKPISGGLPDWRRATIAAADCLASRIVNRSGCQ